VTSEPVRLCFVCLGNICRSPTAEGVMAALVADAGLTDAIEVHSAGTIAAHLGSFPDPRARAEARRRGLDLTSRASRFRAGDTAYYDLVLAMDRSNLTDLRDLTPESELRSRLHLLRSFDPRLRPDDRWNGEVPDPFDGADDGFAEVFDLIDAACRGVLDHVRTELLP